MNEGISYEAFESYLLQQRYPKYNGLETYHGLLSTLATEPSRSRSVALVGSWLEDEVKWIEDRGWTAEIHESAQSLVDNDSVEASSVALVICRLGDAKFDPKAAYQIVSSMGRRLSGGGVLILEVERTAVNASAPLMSKFSAAENGASELLLVDAADYLGFAPVETRYFPISPARETGSLFVVVIMSQKPSNDQGGIATVIGDAIMSTIGYREGDSGLKTSLEPHESLVNPSKEIISAMRDWRSQSKMSADVIAELSSAALEAGSVSHRLSKAERRIRRLTWQAAIFLPVTYPLSMVIAGAAGFLARMKEKKRAGRFDTKKKLSSDQQKKSERQIVTTTPQAGGYSINDIEPKILIIKLDHIGDFILSLPAIKLLRDAWPNGHYTIVCSPTNSGLAKASGYFDDVKEYNFFAQLSQDVKKADMSAFSQIRDIVGEEYDIAIDLRHDQDTRPILAFVDAKIKAGYQTHGKQFVPLDVSLPPIPERSGLHKSPHNIRRLMLLCSHVVNSVKTLEFEAGHALIAAGQFEFPWAGGKYAILAPGGGTLAKKWSAEKFSELAVRLSQSHGLRIVVLGGAQEKEYGEAISKALPEGKVFDLTGNLPLVDMATVSAGAAVFVGTDTGATQLAALLGTPTVAVFSGVADVNLWQPVGTNVEVVRRPIPCSPCYIARIENCVQDHACMNDIQVDHVYKAAESLMFATN
ncbi:glycosyltransferase family 9 protein [Rhizobium sp. X9]|uniref:glycosyltransferase family 9 protein n=1 Tax=Rhizobium sp. X9 TaxID=2815360 RepID=UPI001C0D6FA3|nr:glycosyltransferase family 9 protein [Rhizobium sp. X9]